MCEIERMIRMINGFIMEGENGDDIGIIVDNNFGL